MSTLRLLHFLLGQFRAVHRPLLVLGRLARDVASMGDGPRTDMRDDLDAGIEHALWKALRKGSTSRSASPYSNSVVGRYSMTERSRAVSSRLNCSHASLHLSPLRSTKGGLPECCGQSTSNSGEP